MKMKRRDFITLLGGTAAAWPFAARAQQPRRIGVMLGLAENDLLAKSYVAAFRGGMQQLGWTEGRNVRIDYRWPADDPELIRAYVAELVGSNPDVLFTNSGLVLQPLKGATRSIPIVFVTITDPVGSGYVASLARPGGNLTGFANSEFATAGKLLELLKEVAPGIVRAAVMLNPEQSPQIGMWRAIEAVAPSLGVGLTAAAVHDQGEIERAIVGLAQTPNGGLIVLPNPVTMAHRDAIIALAARHGLPAVYRYRDFVSDGGMLSYGENPTDQYQQAASYVDRILKGEKPADLPIQQPTKLKLIINLKTAKALGLAIPESFLLRADEVIE
jgi:putative ABC transport system substrate-binding protein